MLAREIRDSRVGERRKYTTGVTLALAVSAMIAESSQKRLRHSAAPPHAGASVADGISLGLHLSSGKSRVRAQADDESEVDIRYACLRGAQLYSET